MSADVQGDKPEATSGHEDRQWDRDLARLLDPPLLTASFKQSPEDFQVDEILGFEPDGDGNHWILHVRKVNANTSELIEFLAKSSGCSERDVGFCGLKDRHARTTQWCTIPVGRVTDPVDPWAFPWPETFQLIDAQRHGRKLRRGTHRGNRFRITLRDVLGADPSWPARIDALQKQGFPNYFSEQRFGRNGANLGLVARMGEVGGRRRWNRRDRNWGLSTLRALIFNQVLSARLRAGSQNRVMEGDVPNLLGSRSRFVAQNPELADLQDRLVAHDLVLTGPLWGDGPPSSEGSVQAIEMDAANQVLEAYGRDHWIDLLHRWNAEPDRRPLMVVPEQLRAEQDEAARTLVLSFSLPSGSYATALMRELVELGSSDGG